MKVTVLKSNKPISEASWPDTDVEEGFEAFIGRSEDCHVHIEDPLVSRHHVVLKFERKEWRIEKLSQLAPVSVNGQVLNGELVVHQGDLIAFPPYSVRLDTLSGVQPTQARVTSESTANALPALDDSGMLDDIPVAENMDATVFMSTPTQTTVQPKSTPAAPATAIDDELAEDLTDLPGGEFLAEDNSEAEESFSPIDEDDKPIGEQSHTEEEKMSDDNTENEKPVEDEPSTTDFGSFSEDQGTQADLGGDNSPAMIDDGTESTRVLQKFASYELLLFGEFAPYDRFALDRPEIFIGRDTKKCQIVLTDSEVSSVHAVLRKNLVSLTLEDLNSSNGTLLNGQRINKAELTNGDEFIVGSTTFTVQVVSDLLDAENDRLMPVESGQVIEKIEEIEEEVEITTDGSGAAGIDFSGTEAAPEKSLFKRIWKDPKKKKIAIYSIVGLLLLSLLMDTETTPVKEEPKKEEAKTEQPVDKADPTKKVLTPEEIRSLEAKYKIAEAYVKEKKLDEALAELEQILAFSPDYANAKTLYQYVQEQNRKFKEEQERLKLEAARAKIREEVKLLLVDAKEAVAQRNVPRAEQLFSKILEKDPENMDVTPLKLELETWQAEERAKKEAEARKKAERQRQVDSLAPGKKLYLSKEWYKGILKLEEFLTQKQLDEDLIKEASDMLTDAKAQLASEVAPILGRARSLKEGQDLKGAYEAYLEVLAIEPTNKEGLDEVDLIREILDTRSKKVYREAIISESLSLFGDAKEKFQEVQQISPTDSEYYKKATDKLKNYLE